MTYQVKRRGGVWFMQDAGETWARIEGKIDLLNERNARNSEDIRDLRDKAHLHSNEIQNLKSINSQREGEQRGFDKAIRAVYALCAVCGVSGIAAAIKIIFPTIGGG